MEAGHPEGWENEEKRCGQTDVCLNILGERGPSPVLSQPPRPRTLGVANGPALWSLRRAQGHPAGKVPVSDLNSALPCLLPGTKGLDSLRSGPAPASSGAKSCNLEGRDRGAGSGTVLVGGACATKSGSQIPTVCLEPCKALISLRVKAIVLTPGPYKLCTHTLLPPTIIFLNSLSQCTASHLL